MNSGQIVRRITQYKNAFYDIKPGDIGVVVNIYPFNDCEVSVRYFNGVHLNQRISDLEKVDSNAEKKASLSVK
jgi:hypothetical protein